jgi:hypothetical protein
VRLYNRKISAVVFPDTFAQVIGQFLQRFVLRPGWPGTVEIPDQADTERNVVQIIAMDVAAIDLTGPAASNFNLAVSGGASVTDHKMICQAIPHLSSISMVIIKNLRIPLSSSAVVHHDVTPAAFLHRSTVNCVKNRSGKIFVAWTSKSKPASFPALWRTLQPAFLFET